jgi:Na+/H+ antiporter NhaD/arsenite permease-like protein
MCVEGGQWRVCSTVTRRGNLSVTGSLATILWLAVLRREGLEVGTWSFLRIGIFVMLPALILSVIALSLLPGLP